jgi:hypothetical protein
MISIIHEWLIEHPIWQSIIINALVGLSLVLLGAYWKVIVAFSRIPPQRFGTWLRKARLNAAEIRLYKQRRANEDSRYALFEIVRLAWRILLIFVLMVFFNLGLSIDLLIPRLPHRDLSPLLLRGFLVLCSSVPAAMIFIYGWGLLRFTSDYAHFKESHEHQLARINKIRAELGLNPKALEIRAEEPIEPPDAKPKFSQGMRVESPKYGEGIVMNSQMDGGYEKVTIRFSLYGIKKMIADLAHLKAL